MSHDGIGSRLAAVGRTHGASAIPVNPPVVRASTFLFETLADFEEASRHPFDGAFYGRVGTPTTFAFEQAMAELEGGFRSIAASSGVAAISATLLAFLDKGDHVLVVDTVCDPVRRFCNRMLARLGIETTFYDPSLGFGIADLIRPNTKLIFMESPGSGTLEVQDIQAIVAAAKAVGVRTAIDNTWATPLFFRPLEHGIDVSIHSGTKYIVGHSDAMLGVVTTNAETYDAVRRATQDLGACAGSEECNLGLRGLRTLEVRLARHSALAGGIWSSLFGRNQDVKIPQLKMLSQVMRTRPVAGGPEGCGSGKGFGFRKRLDGGYNVGMRSAHPVDIVPDSFRFFRDYIPAMKNEWRAMKFRVGRRTMQETMMLGGWKLDQRTPFETYRIMRPVPGHHILDQATINFKQLFPAFRDMVVNERMSAWIDVTPDAIPVISGVDAIPGFYVSTGYSGHGFGIAPAAGRLMMELITGDTPHVDPEPFRHSRFIDGSKINHWPIGF